MLVGYTQHVGKSTAHYGCSTVLPQTVKTLTVNNKYHEIRTERNRAFYYNPSETNYCEVCSSLTQAVAVA
jgi:hypothetical protein